MNHTASLRALLLAVVAVGISACATTRQQEAQPAPQAEAPAETQAAAPAAPASGLPASYEVKRGDNLWNIAGQSRIYGNPYQWPLIYRANSDKIKDADLVHPGQNLAINRMASGAEIDAAVQHARTRGAWSVGVTEAADKAYLSR
jgi:nucleoid-associated protein YgaU